MENICQDPGTKFQKHLSRASGKNPQTTITSFHICLTLPAIQQLFLVRQPAHAVNHDSTLKARPSHAVSHLFKGRPNQQVCRFVYADDKAVSRLEMVASARPPCSDSFLGRRLACSQLHGEYQQCFHFQLKTRKF